MTFLRRLSNMFFRSPLNKSIDIELESRIRMRTDGQVAAGVSLEHVPKLKLRAVKSRNPSPGLAPLPNLFLMALSGSSIPQDLDRLSRNEFRPPTFPSRRSLTWQTSTIASARSLLETR